MSRDHSYSHSRAHSPTFPALYLRHNSFSNPSVTSPTSQLILQPFRRFTYVTAQSPTLPSLYLCHRSFSNPFVHLRHSSFSSPSFASPTSQALHLRHLASRPWVRSSRRNVEWRIFITTRKLHIVVIMFEFCASSGQDFSINKLGWDVWELGCDVTL